MKKICFEVDEQIWDLAVQWFAIEQTIMPENYLKLPECDRFKVVKKLQEEWEAWTKLHDLVVIEKPLKICGIKVPKIRMRNYELLKDVTDLIRIFARYPYGIIKKTK